MVDLWEGDASAALPLWLTSSRGADNSRGFLAFTYASSGVNALYPATHGEEGDEGQPME